MKKILAMVLAAAMALSMVACGTQAEPEVTDQPETAKEKAVVVVSFGTSFNETREVTLDAIEADVTAAYPEWEVTRAYTAQTVIDILSERDGMEVENVTEVLTRLAEEGYKEVVLQPTHVMNGAEYDDVVAEVTGFVDSFETLKIGAPLLTSAEDYATVAESIMGSLEEAGSTDTAVVFMGHGTHHYANSTYSQLELTLQGAGYTNAFVGTVEGYPTLDDVMAKVEAMGASKVVLYPLMVVAGDHANNDMAGDEADTWKVTFQNAGYEVECRLEGLGQNTGVREVYLDHLQAAIDGEAVTAPVKATVEAGANDPEKKAILAVSFGTSFNDTCAVTIDAIEADLAKAYPEWDVRRAFTAQTVIDILADRDGNEIDNVATAMEKLIAEGYGTVVVQPTHVMAGAEYDDVVAEVNAYADYFASLTISNPMLVNVADYEAAVAAIAANVPEAASDDTAVVLMGHGTHHFACSTYSQLQNMFWGEGYDNVFVGTVEGYPALDDVMANLEASGVSKVVMYPFMIVAGDHANNDMAGDEADAWKVILTEAGYEVECRLEGLGENAGIRELIIAHAEAAMTGASH